MAPSEEPTQLGAPPKLPHVTDNVIPLSNILRFYTQESYKQLSRVIENLAITRTTESDVTRKRKFLEVIILLRQDFLKIYTLIKWAQNSKDVGKLIDILNHLRQQEAFFQHLAMGLNEMNHFLAAKLPNPDIPTALDVLTRGRPQLPSYNFLAKPKVSSEKILQVLHDLNLALTARMALTEDMPKRFQGNYEVKDGRVIFTVPNEFQVSVTAGNDLIAETDEDYVKSPYYFIDFAFMFGINPDTSFISQGDSRVVTALPKLSLRKLETIANQVLLKLSLPGLYDLLHQYSIYYKLYLISRQLKDLSLNSKWRKNIQFQYKPSLIIINYWCKLYLSTGWKLFIEIGIDKQYNLNFRWFKNGKYVTEERSEAVIGSGVTDDLGDLSVDSILNLVINKHSKMFISRIYDELSAVLPRDAVSVINSFQLLIELNSQKSVVLAINPLSGLFYFLEPSSIEMHYEAKINSPVTTRNNEFVSEKDLTANVVANLISLRLEMCHRIINTKLVTNEWIPNDIIKINEFETVKLFTFDVDKSSTTRNQISFYRSPNWPNSWFLINMVSGLSSELYWWVARIKSIKGEWKIQWVQKLVTDEKNPLDFAFFKNLAQQCSNTIINHMVIEELRARGFNYLVLENADPMTTLGLKAEDFELGSNIALFNDGLILPTNIALSTVFLTVLLSISAGKLTLHSALRGTLTSSGNANPKFLSQFNFEVQDDPPSFSLFNSEEITSKVSANSDGAANAALLDLLFANLDKVKLLIKVLLQLQNSNTTENDSVLQKVVFHMDPYYKPFTLFLPTADAQKLSLAANSEEQKMVHTVVRFLNDEILHSPEALVGSFRYLKEAVNLFKAINVVSSVMQKGGIENLQNGLLKLQFEAKFLNLMMVLLVFAFNYFSSPKKVASDRIILALKLTKSSFDSKERVLVRFSMKENLNTHNLKYKGLFEKIFKAIGELQQEAAANPTQPYMTKLNYDVLLESSLLEPLLRKISDCFIAYSKSSA